MNKVRALRILVRVRRRRGQALDDAVMAAVRAHEASQAAEQLAGEQVQAAVAAVDAARFRLAAMMDSGQIIDVTAMTGRQHQVEAMAGKVGEAEAELQRCAADTARCRQDVKARRDAVSRNRQKIDALDEDIQRLLRERQQSEDDQQDEEAEEAAIGRMIAAAAAQVEGVPA
jgi:chromosome segregation ATPase